MFRRFRRPEDVHPFSARILDLLFLCRHAVEHRRNLEGFDIEQPFAKRPARALRESHLHIRPLLKVDTFHEAHLARAQRQDH
jgi:hypothetical protein